MAKKGVTPDQIQVLVRINEAADSLTAREAGISGAAATEMVSKGLIRLDGFYKSGQRGRPPRLYRLAARGYKMLDRMLDRT